MLDVSARFSLLDPGDPVISECISERLEHVNLSILPKLVRRLVGYQALKVIDFLLEGRALPRCLSGALEVLFLVIPRYRFSGGRDGVGYGFLSLFLRLLLDVLRLHYGGVPLLRD